MSKKFGIPYLGSKSKIAEEIVSLFPCADNFYDLFAGGCAITHALIARNHNLFGGGYKNYIINDIQDGPQLFLDAVAGKYRNEKRWISREDFINNLKLDKPDPYIKWIWSFSNNGKGYLFSKKIEPIKKAFHYIVMFGDFKYFDELYENEFLNSLLSEYGIDHPYIFLDLYKREFGSNFSRREHLRVINFIQKNYLNTRYAFLELEQLERLEQLQRLQQLEQLQRLQQLEQLQQDYKSIELLPNSVIYCDPPYNTGYNYYTNTKFNWKEFWSWAENQTCPVFVSEYSYTGDNPEKWKVIYEKEKINLNSIKSDGTRNRNIERVYWNGLKPPNMV